MNDYEKYLKKAEAITEVGKGILYHIEQAEQDEEYYKQSAESCEDNCKGYYLQQAEARRQQAEIWKELESNLRLKYIGGPF